MHNHKANSSNTNCIKELCTTHWPIVALYMCNCVVVRLISINKSFRKAVSHKVVQSNRVQARNKAILGTLPTLH